MELKNKKSLYQLWLDKELKKEIIFKWMIMDISLERVDKIKKENMKKKSSKKMIRTKDNKSLNNISEEMKKIKDKLMNVKELL